MASNRSNNRTRVHARLETTADGLKVNRDWVNGAVVQTKPRAPREYRRKVLNVHSPDGGNDGGPCNGCGAWCGYWIAYQLCERCLTFGTPVAAGY